MLDISVVIPTKNRAQDLDMLLDSLSRQTIQESSYEVLVIDNGSVDDTEFICNKWTSQISNLRYIYNNNPGLHVGRNLGYQESNSNLLVFIDDDVTLSPDWLEAIVEGFNDSEVMLIGGNVIPNFKGQIPDWMNQLWIEDGDVKILADYSCILFKKDDNEVINPYYVIGCNFAVRKSVLDETLGFHPDGMPDALLCYRGDGESYISQFVMQHSMKACFISGATVYHSVTLERMTFSYLKKIAYRTGISHAYIKLRNNCMNILLKEIWEKRAHLFLHPRMDRVYAIKEKEFIRGMVFLLKEYKRNKDVVAWVHQQDYLAENGYITNERNGGQMV